MGVLRMIRVVGAIAIVPLVVASLAAAADEAPQVRKNPPRLTADTAWSLRLPKAQTVAYRGVASFDTAAGPGGGMLYPAPNAAVAIVALLTHATVVQTAKAKQMEKLQEDADKVLLPYRLVIDGYTHRELMQRALDRLPASVSKSLLSTSDKPASGWWMDCALVFSMTQDQRAFVLDNTISVYAPDDSSLPAYVNAVRVISPPRNAPDMVVFWAGNAGEHLKEESISLFAESMDLALSEATGRFAAVDNAQKTIRYPEGGQEKMERAQPVRETCDRVLMRTLRGGLMSVPRRRADDAPVACDPVPKAQ
jgi:hypothetical protein